MSASLHPVFDALTVADLRARGSVKWTQPGPDGLGAAVAEMDFRAAPPILAALAMLSADANFGYLPEHLALELAAACGQYQLDRYGWRVDPGRIHPVPDVLKALEVAIVHYSRPGSAVILPTPAYMPFLSVPAFLGRQIIEVPMISQDGLACLDLDGIEAAYRDGGDLLIFCNPYNPLGRVFTAAEMTAVTAVVDRHGGRVFSDEIHAPLVYPGSTHLPYASTCDTAAAHTLTATSASKGWNLPGLKCAQILLSNAADERVWEQIGIFVSHGVATPGVVAHIAAYRDGQPWLDDVLTYLDGNRLLLGELLATHLPQACYRPPEGTYLAWLDCTALDLPDSPGVLVSERGNVRVVDGPAFGAAGAGSLRLNFATSRPILTQIVERLSHALT